jgi:hypothetical protein
MKFTMLMFGGRRYPTRPSLADLCVIQDPVVHRLALVELNRLLDAGLASVYVPAAADFWNVWLGHQLAPPHGRRITLNEWASEFAAQRSSEQPGAAA